MLIRRSSSITGQEKKRRRVLKGVEENFYDEMKYSDRWITKDNLSQEISVDTEKMVSNDWVFI